MPISPESHYCLTGMVEFLDITSDVYHGVLDIMKYDLDGMYDNMPHHNTEEYAVFVTSVFDNWYSSTASTNERDYVNYRLINSSSTQFHEVVLGVTNDLISNTDSTNVRTNSDVQSYIENDDPRVRNYIENYNNRLGRALSDTTSTYQETLIWYGNVFINEANAQIEALRGNSNQKKLRSVNKSNIKNARKAAIKGINLFKRLFGEKKIRAFLGGGEFIVEGERYNYCIKPKNNIISHTMNPNSVHIPYHLDVLTKDNVVMGSGCTTFERTPVIDQLIAFMLHVKDDEEHLLKNMNITQRTDAYQQDIWLRNLKEGNHRNDENRETTDRLIASIRNISERSIPPSTTVLSERDEKRKKLKPLVVNAVEEMIDAPPLLRKQITDIRANMDEDLDNAFIEYQYEQRMLEHSE